MPIEYAFNPDRTRGTIAKDSKRRTNKGTNVRGEGEVKMERYSGTAERLKGKKTKKAKMERRRDRFSTYLRRRNAC
jgi:hypothetical protein